MHRIIGILLVCLAFLHATAGVVAEEREARTNDDMRYASRISYMDRDLGPSFDTRSLLSYPPFVALASEGNKNLEPCIKFLSQEGRNMNERMIALLSMHRLGVRDYTKFLRELTNLFDQGRVSADELGDAAIPSKVWSTVTIDNFKNDEVRSVLSEIARRRVGEGVKESIQVILSGDAKLHRDAPCGC
jgi:hypothetical protein